MIPIPSCTLPLLLIVVAFDWYVTADRAEDTAYVQSCLEDSEQVQKEDIWLCERVQAGLQSPVYNTGNEFSRLYNIIVSIFKTFNCN